MTLVVAILPIAFLVAAMTMAWPRRWLPLPAHVALPGVALLAYGLRFFQPHDTAPAIIHAAVVDGVLSSLTPLAIVFGAVLLFKTMDKSGAMAVLSTRLRALTPDPIAQLMLVGWAFSFLIEGLSGFGTPAALAAPILVGLGFPALRVAAMCLIMNSVPVSFGAVGTPTWFGLSGVDLATGELGEIGWRTALVHAAAAPLVAVLALGVVAPWAAIRRRLGFVLLVIGASVGPYLLAARYNVEFPSIVGGVVGLIGAAGLVRWRIGLASVTELSGMRLAATNVLESPTGTAPMSLARATMPIAATVLLLAVTRIDALGLKAMLNSDAAAASASIPGLGQAWISPALVVGLRGILGSDADWRMPLLYVPFILPFVVVALAALPVLKMPRATARAAWAETFTRLARPAIALAGALVLAKVMTAGGDQSPVTRIGLALAEATGGSWPFFAPLLGALGAFFSGSNTVSNLTFAPIQAAISDSLGLDRITVLALQSAGGAMGNMVCIHNIVAVGAVLGLSERRGADHGPGEVASVLRLTIGPLAVYAVIATAMAGVLAMVYS
ncbi:MAG: L-lactate permease [Phycisphaerales bacterium]|nr:L-lactate permease [Phycisphaerales bacterium]